MTTNDLHGLSPHQAELLSGGNISDLRVNDDQAEAIKARGKVLVSAAAGSGKTATMIKRVILMLDEGIKLKDMLILAYNNAAADELKRKLRDAIFDAACSGVDGSERFAAELDSLSFCHISTIHSYCQTLIRENFEKLGISPAFEVVDEQTYEGVKLKALNEVINEYAARGDSRFYDLREIFAKKRKEENLKQQILKIFELMVIQPDREEFLRGIRRLFEDKRAYEDELAAYYRIFFREFCRYIDGYIEIMTVGGLTKYADALVYFKQIAERFINADSIEAMRQTARNFAMPDRGRITKDVTGELRVKYYEAKALMDEAKDFIDGVVKVADMPYYDEGFAQNAVYIDAIVTLTLDFEKRLKEIMRERNAMSFDDLMSAALRLLEGDRELCGKFDAVFVDEYQDVNLTQERIIELLIGGDCFMVGDTKQSIYGFRLADPRIYANRKRLYEREGVGRVINFNENFRSQRKILEVVNNIFDAVMTYDLVGIDYKNDGRFRTDIPRLKDGAPVETTIFLCGASKEEAKSELYDITKDSLTESNASRQEGLYIANTIKQLVGHAILGKGVAEYSDVTVLFRSRSSAAQEIVNVLVEEGIPVNSSVFKAESGETERELLNFLKVIDNPRRDIPLAGFLLGFFGGMSEQELADVAGLKGDCLYDKLCAAARSDIYVAPKARALIKVIDDHRLRSSFVSVSELIAGIINEYMYDAYLMSRSESGLAIARAMMTSVGAKEYSLGRFLEEYVPVGGAELPSGGGNRVQISTFHGYKGLENEIVFVADMFNRFSTLSFNGELLAFNRGVADGGTCFVGLKYFDMLDRVYYPSLSIEAIKCSMRLNQIKDEMRLLYVALTRARSRLYLTGTKRASKDNGYYSFKTMSVGCAMDFVLKARHLGADIGIFNEAPMTSDIERAREQGKGMYSGRPELTGVLEKALDKAGKELARPSGASLLATKYTVSAIDSGDGQVVAMYEEAAKTGSAYHTVMQYIDYDALTLDAVKEELARMESEGLLTKEQREVVSAEEILACLHSELMAKARAAERMGKCRREYSFMMLKPANTLSDKEEFACPDRTLVQGVIDLYIDGDKRIIVDFKNSKLADKDMLERYKKQLYLYKMAIESAFSVKVDQVALYSFKTGKTYYL